MGVWESWGTVATAGEGRGRKEQRDATPRRRPQLPPQPVSGPLSCREQTPGPLSVVNLGTWAPPVSSPNHDFSYETTDHRSLRERFASSFILRPSRDEGAKGPWGALRMSGTNAYMNIGTIKRWSKQGGVKDAEKQWVSGEALKGEGALIEQG